jgi:uncharacterized membrane protein YbaN (DUF454 family)
MTQPAQPDPKHANSKIARAMWTGFGLLALGAGVIGVVLPVLPTTPFVILAAFCFSKSSPRLRNWLLTHRIFGALIRDWEATGAIAPRYKAIACCAMVLAFGLSLALGLKPLILGIQAICLGGAALYILSRPNGAPKN